MIKFSLTEPGRLPEIVMYIGDKWRNKIGIDPGYYYWQQTSPHRIHVNGNRSTTFAIEKGRTGSTIFIAFTMLTGLTRLRLLSCTIVKCAARDY
jgi:hypothetical protein